MTFFVELILGNVDFVLFYLSVSDLTSFKKSTNKTFLNSVFIFKKLPPKRVTLEAPILYQE